MLVLVVVVGYVIAFFLLRIYTEDKSSAHPKTSMGSFELPLAFSYRQLFALSVLGLYFEMLMIRWLSSEIRIFAYYKNLVLIACFLGFWLGCALCRRRVHPIATAVPLLFYKGESQEKKLPGDWKDQRFLPGSPAHVMLVGSWGFLFSQSHVVVVTTPSVSDATSSTVAKIANHGSI